MLEHGSPTLPPLLTATYRLQFHAGFTLRHALELVDYLAGLGVSHVYASPILTARPGSTHGYDIVNHNEINPELGTPEDFETFVEALHQRGMGLILDIVPNHMGVGGKDNAWWLDTLEWGERSPYARYFDIDFKTNRRGLRGKVMIPVLGDQYGKVLESGEIELRFDIESGTFSAWYHDHRFPIDPRDYSQIIGRSESWRAPYRELLGRFEALEQLEADVYEEGQGLKRQLAQRAQSDPALERHLSAAAKAFQGTPGQLETWLRLHALLENQSYRPAYWRAAADEINYRRFFNINDLAGVRVEQEDLFEETHRLVLSWVKDEKVQGLRIDHIDGLFDPKTYCERLQARAGSTAGPAYIIVEKILAPHERLPSDWPISGTSGYDTLNLINGVFVDPDGERGLDRVYRKVTGRPTNFDEVLGASKKLIMQAALASEMNVLANELHRLSSADLSTRDFTLRSIRDAIEEVFVQMPIYRTYVTPQGGSEQDRRYIEWAIGKARKASKAADTSVFDFLQNVLTGTLASSSRDPSEVFRVAMRAQQISGPVMAKGMEDTAFYRYHRLISLNEVGGDPRRFGVSVATFHRANAERLEQFPDDMLAGSTHDTKRGEDARARLNVLSELPLDWARQVRTWLRSNRSRRVEVEGADPMPYPGDEYLFYQTLVGAWPLGLVHTDEAAMGALAERIAAFMRKALREGKENSSWDNPNDDYEQAVEQFVHETLRPSATNPFPEQVSQWIGRIARLGAINSLAQTLLRLTMPGVPDTYRGSESWDLSLVDPDNRRPVDYAERRRLLELAERTGEATRDPKRRQAALRELSAHYIDGREKVYLIGRALGFRRAHPQVFGRGSSYTPLLATGKRTDHVCAFARADAERRAITIVPRLLASLTREDGSVDWGDTTLTLPAGNYRCVLSGARFDASAPVPVADLLADLPVALLVTE